ncbi:alpha-L-rhamnosidase A [Magnaporthiopsis poae ATCC 64411]|uniref:alpha-L-rhamnosidase n=1 Tax=Magnaporthiopsis poae (strain ATCC 64411 / 73-15) TaxID=644358 RepID=A0A0C4EEA9_MAGP6|nr:alpha-L-rhamnosidase A [Magnaporthiopsis poae ATCC 64411]
MPDPSPVAVVDVRFEHHRPGEARGIDETEPRLSWRFANAPPGFYQEEYEIQLSRTTLANGTTTELCSVRVESPESQLVPWPLKQNGTAVIGSRETISARIKSARLHITSQGLYEAEINGRRVGDYALAPGWTVYYSALAYQTYDVTEHLRAGANCIGVRVAEGWFSGRLGWEEGGKRNIYGNRTALLAQLEVTMSNGSTVTVATDKTWLAARGPVRLAEIYDGEKYDATAEIPGWSSAGDLKTDEWTPVDVLPPLPTSVNLRRGSSEPVRRVQTIKPVAKITTPSGKTVLDFGQNLVGFLRLRGLRGSRGHSILLSHAEVLEHGELGTRPLRQAKAQDKYTLRGGGGDETYEPRFTFHGFRYAQIDGWPAESGDLEASVEAVMVHTDMEARGSFACSDERLNRLFENVRWSMRGNFLSIPTDCPQRNERLGWTGDLAVFSPTANFLYGPFGLLRDWLAGLRADQRNLGGMPPLVSPDIWWKGGSPLGGRLPAAVWHDVVVLAPWAMWEATGDIRILEEQYQSIQDWLKVIPRDKNLTHLWDLGSWQLGDWLDPDAPPENPAGAKTNAVLVANAFLINSLDHASKIATLLGRAGA